MAAEPEAKKRRSWGKPRHREKIASVDNMEVDEVVGQSTVVEHDVRDIEIDLQHPEMIKTERLVEILTRMKVPIPVYPDKRPSRERLVYLFRKHVTPRPQRQGLRGRKRPRRGADTPMEVELCWHDDWSRDGEGSSDQGTPLQRKRKLEDGVITSPPKRSVDIPCSSFSKISVSNTAAPTPAENSAGTCPSPAQTHSKPSPRVIKIRRSRTSSSGSSGLGSGQTRQDSPSDSGRTADTAQLPRQDSSHSIQKPDPSVVNGKSRPQSEDGGHEKLAQKPVQKITWP